MNDTAVIHLALSKRAAQLVRDACNHERFERVVTVTPDEFAIFRSVTEELDAQIGGLAPTPTPVPVSVAAPRAQDIAEQMAAAGTAAVKEAA